MSRSPDSRPGRYRSRCSSLAYCGEGADRSEVAGLDDVGAARALARHRLDRGDCRDQAGALARRAPRGCSGRAAPAARAAAPCPAGSPRSCARARPPARAVRREAATERGSRRASGSVITRFNFPSGVAGVSAATVPGPPRRASSGDRRSAEHARVMTGHDVVQRLASASMRSYPSSTCSTSTIAGNGLRSGKVVEVVHAVAGQHDPAAAVCTRTTCSRGCGRRPDAVSRPGASSGRPRPRAPPPASTRRITRTTSSTSKKWLSRRCRIAGRSRTPVRRAAGRPWLGEVLDIARVVVVQMAEHDRARPRSGHRSRPPDRFGGRRARGAPALALPARSLKPVSITTTSSPLRRAEHDEVDAPGCRCGSPGSGSCRAPGGRRSPQDEPTHPRPEPGRAQPRPSITLIITG